jgi:hypothetical protein
MKVSVVTQYYNRRSQFINSLKSFANTYLPKSDLEIIVVDDASNEEHRIDDINEIFPELNIKLYSFKKEDKWWSCPVLPINKGLSMATGDVIILHCAECMFIGDVILDVRNRIKPNDYLVYATLSISQDITESLSQIPYSYLKTNPFDGGWYQHSVYNNNCYNFCTAILKVDMDKLGGFDERFAFGYQSGDLDFIRRVRNSGMNVISIDNPLTYHQWHPPYLFNEFSVREKVSNLSSNSLYDYIVKNEPDTLKVVNSFLEKDNYIPKEPELKPILNIVDFQFEVTTNNNGILLNFLCSYSNISIDFQIKDISNGYTQMGNLLNNTWISYNIYSNLYEIEISYKGKILISFDIEENEKLVFNIKKQIEILKHF